jgi:hypothetical protein
MRKAGIILTLLGPPLAVFSGFVFAYDWAFPLAFTVLFMISGVVSTAVGPAFILFPLNSSRRKKIETRALIFSILVIIAGLICRMYHVPGISIMFIIAVVLLCFFYGTLAFKNKYEKWKIYTRSKRDAFFLSLFDFVGIGSLFLGLLFKMFSWPMANIMTTVGLVVLAIGMLAWNQKFKKEVVFRKETEDKLQASFEQIEYQHQKLEEKQKEIIDSIRYAKRIQHSRMPTEKYIDSNLNRLNKKQK